MDIKNDYIVGHTRTIKAKKQIVYSLYLKGIGICVGLVYVPLILNYLDTERYGIWLTLSSIIAWFSFFDVGLGNGLRNCLTKAIAIKDHNLAKTYVSTTYGIVSVVFIFVLIIFYILNPLLNWQKILNTTAVGTPELSEVAFVIFTFFILQFVFKLIGTILLADQRPALNNSFSLIGNMLSLLIIIILTKTTKGALINLASVLSIVPLFVLIAATIYFYRKDYKKYIPTYKYIDLSKAKDLLSIGVKYFYTQIAAIILFSMTNLLIAQCADQKAVVAYNITYKYLFIANMVYGIILEPFWSAVTDAYAKSDYDWLKTSLKKLNVYSVIVIMILILLLLISPYVFKIWVGEQHEVPFTLAAIITLYLSIQVIVAPFSTFINGFGKLKLSLYGVTVKILLFIPCALLLGHEYGAIGIVLSMLIIQIPSLLIEPMQTFKIINKEAYGIWNK